MSLATSVKAIVFDYGNTIIEYGPLQVEAWDAAFSSALISALGPFDTALYAAFRARSRNRPFAGPNPHYRENDPRALTRELVQELYAMECAEEVFESLLQARDTAFHDRIVIEPAVLDTLARLKRQYRLGLLSNYPDGPAIRESLRRIGIHDYFDAIVVSGEIGYCKPHPITFAAILQQLQLSAREVLFVGDNWLADIQGAKRVGMQAVHIERWTPVDQWTRNAGDHLPDAVIRALHELEPLLLHTRTT